MRRAIAALSAAAALTLTGTAAVQLTHSEAHALDNGLALTPPMGWNDWNAFKCNVSEQLVEKTADAIVTSGMKAAGYQYVNIDDCWAQPARDANGALVPNPAKFPDGIKAVADHVHAEGLKLGIYEDSGTRTCSKGGGFPGSLGHENADALQFAQWGVDYLKYDDCNVPADGQNVASTIQRYDAMRDALNAATNRPGSRSCSASARRPTSASRTPPGPRSATCGARPATSTTPTAGWCSSSNINVQLAGLAGPGAWNDPDMLEIGNGGMTQAEYQTEFSLWSEMAAPLIAGTDLTKASKATLGIYTNNDVIAVDQDPRGAQGTAVDSANGHWVLTKPLADGSRAVVLFNETDAKATISTTASKAGLPKAAAYRLTDLWSKHTTETAGTISAQVPAHGVVMYKVSRATPFAAPPDATLTLDAPATFVPGQPEQVTETLTDNGRMPAIFTRLALQAPPGWAARPTSATAFPVVRRGDTVQAAWQVTEPTGTPTGTTGPATLTGSARYFWPGPGIVTVTNSQPVVG